MSDPIDYIDLTVDSPVAKSPILRNRVENNIENATHNSRAKKSRKRNLPKRHTSYDTVVEIPDSSTQKSVTSTEVIDLDNVNSSEKTEMCYINSTSENIVVLTCPICYEQLSSKMKPMSTRCGHIFCAQCLELALRKAKRCPTCQRSTKLSSCTRLYF